MIFRLVLVLTTAALVFAGTSSAGMASSPAKVSAQSGLLAASDRSVTYGDPVGDNDGGLAPDISQITVSLIGNRLTFRVGIANLGPGLVEDEFVVVAINTDRNARTGCDGDEVTMGVLGDTYGNPSALWGRCIGGGDFDFGAPQGSFRFSTSPGSGTFGPGAVSFALNASEVGTTNFTFWVGSSAFDDYIDDTRNFSFGSSPSSSSGGSSGQKGSSASGIAITRHPNVKAEATGPNGARVKYAPATVRGAKKITYSKPSGSVFPLGRTIVAVTARNGRRVARSQFAVVVADTTPPTFAPLPAVGTNATEPTRATVTFGPITASDRVDRNVSVTCTPASGSVLAPGATSVSCTARDDAGNTATTALRVAVPVYANQMSLQTNTTFQYEAARLVGATTTIAIAVSPAADGSPVSYAWVASSGVFTGNGPTASWARQLDASGQLAASTVTLTLAFASGRTEVLTIQFP